MEGMEVDLQQAQIILQLRQMNIVEGGGGGGRVRGGQDVQQTGGADSGFNSDKVRNNGPDQSAGALSFVLPGRHDGERW